MHFDLESQIESHLTLAGPGCLPRLAIDAVVHLHPPHGTEQVSPTNLITLLVPMTPPVGSFSKSKAFLVWARKAEHTEHC